MEAVVNPGDVVMARLDTGCVFGVLVHMGRTRAAIQRQGQEKRPWVKVEQVRAWPPPRVEAPAKKVKRGR